MAAADLDGMQALSQDEMVINLVHYLTMTQGKPVPIRKSDILKNALNKQSADFKDVIKEVADVMADAFGVRLIGIKNGPDGNNIQCDILEASSFMMVSKFRQRTTHLIMPEKPFLHDLKKAALLLILTPTYMMDRNVDEEFIWRTFEKMNFAHHLCKKREDLRRFLKSEYVDCLYLNRQEIKDTEEIVMKYGWGLRADLEFSKYALLKFAVQFSYGKQVRDFPMHFSKLSPQEIEMVEREDKQKNRASDAEDSESDSEETQQIPSTCYGEAIPSSSRAHLSKVTLNKGVVEMEDSD